MKIIPKVILYIIVLYCPICISDKRTIDDTSSRLIDSLVIPLAPDQRQTAPKPAHSNKLPPKPDDDLKKPEQYPLANRMKQSGNSVSDMGEITCPKIYCYVIRDRQLGETRLDCKNEVFSSPDIVTLIDCRFWLTSTSQRDSVFKDFDFSQLSINEGRGYDLKLVLRPSSSNHKRRQALPSPLLKIDRLSPGILQWIIRVIRENLNMRLSPIHLSISFMYFGRLSRDDLAVLPISARVTRLSLWNPLKWDEDSFIAHASYKSIAPPYFRLTVFCDHENRASSFDRLWLPWKTWQIRFNHCPNIYACRNWNSPYPICDMKNSNSSAAGLGMKTFMPSFMILAKEPEPLIDKSMAVPAQYGSGMQILFNSQCNHDVKDLAFLGDLKLDSASGCWERGVFTPKIEKDQSVNSEPEVKTVLPEAEPKLVVPPVLETNLSSSLSSSIITANDSVPTNSSNVGGSEQSQPILKSAEIAPDTVYTAGSNESLSRLTIALILLALFNILLLLCFIVLVLWIRRKIQKRRQAHQRLTKDSDPSQSDLLTYGNHDNGFTPLIGSNQYSSQLTGLNHTPMFRRPMDSYSMPKLNQPYPGNGYPNPIFYNPSDPYVNTSQAFSNPYQNGSLHLSLQRKRRRKSLNEPGSFTNQPPPIPQRPWRAPSASALSVTPSNHIGYLESDQYTNHGGDQFRLSPQQPWSDSRTSIRKPISFGNLNRQSTLDQPLHQSTMLIYPQRGISKSSLSKSIEMVNQIDPVMTTSMPPQSPTRFDRQLSPRPKIKPGVRRAPRKPHTLVFENGDLGQSPFVSESLRKSLSQLV